MLNPLDCIREPARRTAERSLYPSSARSFDSAEYGSAQDDNRRSSNGNPQPITHHPQLATATSISYNSPMAGLSYENSGVDYDRLDAFKRACQQAAAQTVGALAAHNLKEPASIRGESAYLLEAADHYLAHVEEGLGTKNLVADEMLRLTGRTFYRRRTLVRPDCRRRHLRRRGSGCRFRRRVSICRCGVGRR